MQLPGNSIGISDLLGWRECPKRFAHQMRRHVEGAVPGEINWTTGYGSAIHEAIHLVAEGATHGAAIDRVWADFATHLDPEHLQMLTADLETYESQSPPGFELIAAETDCRVPLMVHEGEQIYFRFKIDALYRRVEEPTVFYARDYKSSAHEKSKKEVDADLQQWAYNWAIHELYPECRSLIQSYEQLRFVSHKTSKNAEQRAQMRDWLVKTAQALLADEKLEPKQNQFCAWCPMVATCDQTVRATKYWRGRLAMLAPMTKEGRKTRIELMDEGMELEEVVSSILPQMQQTRKHLEAAEKELKRVIEEMSSEDRERLGWRLAERRTKVFSSDGLQALHDILGPSFYEVISLSRTEVEKVIGKPKRGEALTPEQQVLRDAELERVSATTVVPHS